MSRPTIRSTVYEWYNEVLKLITSKRPQQSSHLLSIPDEIMRTHIFSFLDCNDVLSLRSTCQTTKRKLNIRTLNHENFEPLSGEQGWRDVDVDDEETYWFSLTPINSDITHSVTFVCKWKDQGWGNLKGLILIRDEERNLIVHSRTAGHNWSNLKLEFRPEPGKNYIVNRYVGCGGGHQLFIENPRFYVLEFVN